MVIVVSVVRRWASSRWIFLRPSFPRRLFVLWRRGIPGWDLQEPANMRPIKTTHTAVLPTLPRDYLKPSRRSSPSDEALPRLPVNG